MINFFRNLEIDSTSFWLGFLSGILFAWIISRLRIYIPAVFRILRKRMSGVKESFTVNAEVRLRTDTYRFAQKQHIASSLFSLDEIAITPKVLMPVLQSSQTIQSAPTDSVSLSIPYMPDWPEMASIYNAPTMTLIEALQGGADILLAGNAGSGKTFALAWLASVLSRKSPGLGVLADILPLYIHATDVLHLLHITNEDVSSSQKKEENSSNISDPINDIYITDDPLDILIKSISTYTSPLTTPRLSGIVHSALANQRAIIIIDRVDELPPHQASVITAYILSLRKIYPRGRFIVSASYDNLAGLPSVGFSLLGMAAWNDNDRANFLSGWSRLWAKWIVPLHKTSSNKVSIYFLNSWLLQNNNAMLRPFEYVLKVWAAFCGDIIGTDGPSAIDSYIHRTTHHVLKSSIGLEQFAQQLLLNMVVSSDTTDTERLQTELGSQEDLSSSELSHPTDKGQSQSIAASPIKGLSGVDTLIDNGILISYPGSHYGFSHPILSGYFAGAAISNNPDALQQIQNQPSWTGKSLAMYYMARVGDVTPLINNLMQDDDIIHTNHLLISRWLEIAPKNRPWRSTILRTLTSILQKEKDTICLAAKIVSAMAFSGDSGVSIYFRQLIRSEHSNLKQLGALGCGILRDNKSIEDLNLLLQDQSPSLRRVASLALAAIGDKTSLEILASCLLSGDEQLRRCAAEALANDPIEGHPALKDGSGMEDLMVRRAVVFGLIRVNLPWATKIVENLQLEDKEWVVRNAAIQAFDEQKHKIEYAPKPPVDLTETPWLIDYATKTETTVAPGKPAEDLVVKALANGTHEEIINALQHLLEKCDANTIQYIHAAYLNNTGEIKDLAYYVLWLMMIAGIKISLAVKYNIQ